MVKPCIPFPCEEIDVPEPTAEAEPEIFDDGEVIYFVSSDEEDPEDEGYQPLPVDANESDNASNEEEEAESSEESSVCAPIPAQYLTMPKLWSAMTPESVDITMDSEKENEVMEAMANFTLPSSSIPEWAQQIPEEEWKQHLIDKIHHLHDKLEQ